MKAWAGTLHVKEVCRKEKVLVSNIDLIRSMLSKHLDKVKKYSTQYYFVKNVQKDEF